MKFIPKTNKTSRPGLPVLGKKEVGQIAPIPLLV